MISVHKQRYLIVGLLVITWMIGYLDRLAINTAIIPIAKEFSLNEIQSGLVLSAFFISYTVMQLVGGVLADRFDVRWVMLISVIMWSLFTGLTGLASSFVTMIIVRVMFGIGEGSFPAASTVMIVNLFARDERARAKTIVLSGTTIGTLLGTLISASLISTMGWRSMFYLLGGLGLLLVICFWRSFDSMKPHKPANTQTAQQVPSAKMALRSPMIWMVLISWFSWNMVLWGMNSWMPSYWVNVRGLELMQMGWISVIPALAGILGMLGSGWVIDHWMRRREKFWGATAAGLALLSLIGLYHADSNGMILFFQTMIFMLGSCISATVFVYPLKYVAPQMTGTVTGLINFGGTAAGAISPAFFGYLLSQSGGSYHNGFIFFMIAAMLSGICTWLIRPDPRLLTEEMITADPRLEKSS